jgi:protease-4
VTGLIVDSEKTVDFLDSLREDDAVRGVLVRINSPGGAVGPSQEIFAAVKRLAESKPVVASLGAVAASGGY